MIEEQERNIIKRNEDELKREYFVACLGGLLSTVIYDENGKEIQWDVNNPNYMSEGSIKSHCIMILLFKKEYMSCFRFNELTIGELSFLSKRINIFLEWYKRTKKIHKALYGRALNLQLKSWAREIESAKLAKINIKACLEEMRKETQNKNAQELTEREKEYYNKAIAKGMAEKTQTGYKWIYENGNVTSLAFFLEKIFAPKGVGSTPNERLQSLWNVTRLDRAFDRNKNVKAPQKWRIEIEQLFTTE